MWRLPLQQVELECGARREVVLLSGVLPARPRTAVVGSRAMQRSMGPAIGVVVEALAASGHALVSGGAVGVDEHAHRAALQRGIPQLAILPLGPDRPYPPHLLSLFEAIASAPSSGLLFVRSAGFSPTKAAFVSRNRWIVAQSDRLIVMQAERRSGSLHTGLLGARAGLPVAAVVASSGCDTLVEGGATPISPGRIRASVDDWLCDKRPADPGHDTSHAEWPAALHALRDRLVSGGRGGVALGELTMIEMSQLTRAELFGLVETLDNGRIRPRPRTHVELSAADEGDGR